MVALVASLVAAVILGFSVHRASICSVRAVAEAMHAQTWFIFASIGKTVLWMLAVTLPVFFLIPETVEYLRGWPLTLAAVAGGFVFGLGAGINGACAYSTMTRMVDGEGRMLVAVAGCSLGIFIFVSLAAGNWIGRPAPASTGMGLLLNLGVLVALGPIAWALYEVLRLWRSRPRGKRLHRLLLAAQYRLSTTALVAGVAGASILLLTGAPGYSTTFQFVIEGALGTRPWPATGRWLLVLAVLSGMLLSTILGGRFRLDWRPRLNWLRNLAGGILMGFGVGLAPGGNDALILYGIPSLSPHALPVYAAMATGIAAALLLLRATFGITTRAIVKGDIYMNDLATVSPKP
jgi:uncharacterized membrane protein YedE/YeeE